MRWELLRVLIDVGIFFSCSLSTKPRIERRISLLPRRSEYSSACGLIGCNALRLVGPTAASPVPVIPKPPTDQPTKLSSSASLACLLHPNDDFRLLTAGVYRTLFRSSFSVSSASKKRAKSVSDAQDTNKRSGRCCCCLTSRGTVRGCMQGVRVAGVHADIAIPKAGGSRRLNSVLAFNLPS